MKITFEQLKNLICESVDYNEYEEILCEIFEVDSISKITKEMYEKLLQEYFDDILNEHDSALLEDATDLVHQAVKKNGYNIIAHHGTNKKFSEFKYGDIGFHLGTLEQAEIVGRSLAHGYYSNIIYLNTAISLHNPLIIESDPESWKPEELVDGALNQIYKYRRLSGLDEWEDFHTFAKNQHHVNIVDKKIKEAIQKGDIVIDSGAKYNRSQISFLILYQLLQFSLSEIINFREKRVDIKQAIVNKAKSLGYDGVKYLNMFEVKNGSNTFDYSYIVFDANQIKNCEVISFSNGKIVPLENRFNRNTNNLFEGI